MQVFRLDRVRSFCIRFLGSSQVSLSSFMTFRAKIDRRLGFLRLKGQHRPLSHKCTKKPSNWFLLVPKLWHRYLGCIQQSSRSLVRYDRASGLRVSSKGSKGLFKFKLGFQQGTAGIRFFLSNRGFQKLQNTLLKCFKTCFEKNE